MSPPHPNEEFLSAMALSLVAGVGPKLQSALLSQFGDAGRVLLQPKESLLQVHGIGEKTAVAIKSPTLLEEARQMLAECRQQNVSVIPQSHENYPRRLREICDAPLIFYQKGVMLPQDELSIAIVGSRRCTVYGRRHAERLAAALSRAGFTIVSGLARGIDAAAHRGALQAGGRTLAVLASGVQNIYPPEHSELADEISQQGALLSEMSMNQRPLPGLFPQRNRIISGLCLGVVVIEATRNSGALYTARHAMEQGREVFALPGSVDSLASVGCHDLIRDGGILVRTVDDILEALGPLPMPTSTTSDVTIHSPRELALNPMESQVLNKVVSEPTHMDEIVYQTGLETSRVLATLTVLEMRRLVRRLPGNLFVRHD